MISGYTITRDCILHDYCVEECIRSMLPFCEEVVVGDAMSKDGTRELLERLARETGKIRIVDYPRREDIFDEKDFVLKWVNFTRESLLFPYQFYLDADEVASPEIAKDVKLGETLGKAMRFRRVNFLKDTTHFAPPGTVCSDAVIRSGPSKMWMPMDCAPMCPRDTEYVPIEKRAQGVIFHYGFLRESSAYYRKCRFFQPALIGTHDSRLDAAEKEGVPWMNKITFDRPLGSYTGPHPEIAIPWLRSRGYNPRTR